LACYGSKIVAKNNSFQEKLPEDFPDLRGTPLRPISYRKISKSDFFPLWGTYAVDYWLSYDIITIKIRHQEQRQPPEGNMP
jgi:hypothetical protein